VFWSIKFAERGLLVGTRAGVGPNPLRLGPMHPGSNRQGDFRPPGTFPQELVGAAGTHICSLLPKLIQQGVGTQSSPSAHGGRKSPLRR